jgi:hypothetical protein
MTPEKGGGVFRQISQRWSLPGGPWNGRLQIVQQGEGNGCNSPRHSSHKPGKKVLRVRFRQTGQKGGKRRPAKPRNSSLRNLTKFKFISLDMVL